ncbi:hypothetical protein ACJRO7_032643 [Eucalyptus globulus]|uniref:Gnk2-homologous domain-containing protein n=1 Tax=Eucalyptus globulus TaxID=34317 RepID=A0ABD3JUC6_EUCGL
MNASSQHIAKLLLSFLLLCSCIVVKCRFNNGSVYKTCNHSTYSSISDPYYDDLWNVLDDLMLHTSKDYNYYAKYHSCYGHAACFGALAKSNCDDCVDYAKDFLHDECDLSHGAQVQLQDCRMRYEDYPFIE